MLSIGDSANCQDSVRRRTALRPCSSRGRHARSSTEVADSRGREGGHGLFAHSLSRSAGRNWRRRSQRPRPSALDRKAHRTCVLAMTVLMPLAQCRGLPCTRMMEVAPVIAVRGFSAAPKVSIRPGRRRGRVRGRALAAVRWQLR